MVLVIVTAAVVTTAVLLPILWGRGGVPPTAPSAGPNVGVDDYAAGSAWQGQFGDDPVVATAPNGTVAVAWEGVDELSPPATPGQPPTFNTSIFVSFSADNGGHFSPPLEVAASGTVAALLPSLAYAANGTLYLAYLNATNTPNQAILVKSAAPGSPFSGGATVAVVGQQLGRPWLSVPPQGDVVLAFTYSSLVEWTVSTDGGRSFASPTILGEGVLTDGVLGPGGEVVLVGLSLGALTSTTASIWSAAFDPLSSTPAQEGTAATISLPFPAAISGPNLSRPGPAVAFAGGLLYLVYANNSEGTLMLATSNTNGTSWAGHWHLWDAPDGVVETPRVVTGPGGSDLALTWSGSVGGFWKTYAALYDVRSGLVSSPTTVSSVDGFAASVRNWHGTTMGLALTGTDRVVVAWGDGRGLTGVYGLTHVFACTLTAQF